MGMDWALGYVDNIRVPGANNYAHNTRKVWVLAKTYGLQAAKFSTFRSK